MHKVGKKKRITSMCVIVTYLVTSKVALDNYNVCVCVRVRVYVH